MITYLFDKRDNILKVKFTGAICVEELQDYIVDVRNNKDLPQRLKIFSDATNAKFAKRIGRKELLHLLEENKRSLSEREIIYDAFVVSSAFEMALGMLYREFICMENYRFNIFSTKEAAIHWLINS